MTLHEAIQHVLTEAERPLPAREIAERINKFGLYERSDGSKLGTNQIQSRIRQYSDLFVNVNGQIVLASDRRWKELLTTYWYLANTLRGILQISDVQFLVCFIFFIKRIESRPHIAQRIGVILDHVKNADYFLDNMLLRRNRGKEYFGIFEEAASILSNLDEAKKRELSNLAFRLQLEEYSDKDFGNIFEYFLNLNSLDSYGSPIAYTPKSLRELMVALLKPRRGARLYDPACGTGGLLVEAHHQFEEITLIGSEVNPRIAQLCYMNLTMNGIYDVQLRVSDCFREGHDINSFDYILSDLPLNGVSNINDYNDIFYQQGIEPPKSGKGFSALIMLILSKLSPHGKAVVTVAEGFLSKGGKEKEIRRLLLQEDRIEMVLSLPFGALRPYTDAKASILVLNNRKRNETRNKVHFVKAEPVDISPQSLIIDVEDALKIGNHTIVNLQDIKDDFNLSADAYDASQLEAQELIREAKGRYLGELVEIRGGITPEKRNIVQGQGIPLIRVENLSRDIIDIFLNVANVEDKVLANELNPRYIIDHSCILIARLGENLKATYFKPSDEYSQIVIHSGVYALTPLKSELIDFEYLYYQLRSEFITQQIAKKRLGAVVPYISIAGLRQVVIPYTTFELQRELVNTQKADIVAAERARVDEKIRALGFKEEIIQKETDIVGTLAHQLRPILTSIYLGIQNLSRIIKKNDLGDLREFNETDLVSDDPDLENEISRPANYTINELTKKTSEDSLHVNNVLDMIKKVLSFKLSPHDMSEVDLKQFFIDYFDLKRIEIDNNYEVEIKGDHFIAQISKTAFTDLLNQLLKNAEGHGFSQPKQDKIRYRVQFNIKKSEEREIAIIEYQNNGRRFELTHDDYVGAMVRGVESKGSGIGGNFINRIVEAHKGQLRVKERMTSGFAMTIEFPLKQDIFYESNHFN